MKSAAAALLLAGAASAYEGYGSASSSSSTPSYPVITPCPGCPSSIAPKPCTVTAQYQSVSTCSVPYGPKGTPVCSTYPYVSTTMKDYEGKVKTITKYDEYVTIGHTKTTKTIYPKPTGGYGGYFKNSTKPTYEVYEKYIKVKYHELGPIGYPGGKDYLYKDYYNKDSEETYQPVEVIECYSGKCETKSYTYTHGNPTPSATTYEKPGTYTVPEYTVTVTKSTDECAATTYHATKGDNIYGAITTDVAYPTTFVYPYPSVKYEHEHSKYYSTIIYTTIVYDHPGKYTIVPPTHTYCEGPKDIVYPTPSPVYPGEYTHTKETVTITKSNEPYTCSYQSSSTYTPTTPAYGTTTPPAYGTSTSATAPGPSDYNSAPVEEYGHATAASYVKRGGVIERKRDEVKRAGEKKRVILV
jgi:hypothetical protein